MRRCGLRALLRCIWHCHCMPCGVRCMYVAVSHRKASGRVPLSHRMIYWSSELQTHHTQVHRTTAPPHQCNAQCCIGVRICRLQIRTDVLRTHTAPEPRAVSWHRNESELAFATARSRHGTARSRARHGTARSRFAFECERSATYTSGCFASAGLRFGVSPRVVEGLDIAEFVERINPVSE
jgi:hypothetical protein